MEGDLEAEDLAAHLSYETSSIHSMLLGQLVLGLGLGDKFYPQHAPRPLSDRNTQPLTLTPTLTLTLS